MAIIGGLPSPDVPEWAPLRDHVADYVPHRTLSQRLDTNTAGEDVYRLTFDDDTRPTGQAVDRLIADGVAWIAGRVYPLNVLSESAAAVLVTLYAAAACERGWPADDSSLQRANDLEKRMDLMLTGLITSNNNANSDDGVSDPATHLMPQWSFPSADTRYDSSRYW